MIVIPQARRHAAQIWGDSSRYDNESALEPDMLTPMEFWNEHLAPDPEQSISGRWMMPGEDGFDLPPCGGID
jgi:hypothetical protein